MLPVSKRVRLGTEETSNFFSKSQKYSTKHLICFFQKNKSETKFSVVVSKKVSKKAVDRNLIKKRIYSAFKEVNKKQRITLVWIVVVTKQNLSNNYAYSMLKDEILEICKHVSNI